ncbi:hypothetical protein U876_07610 [Aeromonas hydrophila NJ-35]|nr:hypothetical protein V428_15475 [Aeromonas hydrophila subsp. hydrophila AL09-71]AHX70214.1 hypothetical protein V429_15505 [Aeromonas hydrophila pc104A]AJE38592.1 hypothetical protein V469_07640 [Aeromonas hydrophila J-1]AKJ37007.1 hypothetical protein U876_07610 [Aeromonas hydrophila NJ-35]ALQ62813.1 hypothetical protein AS145_07890 [Aeromonas hydrophila]
MDFTYELYSAPNLFKYFFIFQSVTNYICPLIANLGQGSTLAKYNFLVIDPLVLKEIYKGRNFIKVPNCYSS